MLTFTMIIKLCEGVYDSRFTFNAATQQEATQKAQGWARYHGMDSRDVTARPATEAELKWETNNSYVS